MTLLFLFLVVAVADGKGSVERGVFSHEGTKILLAEKFVNVQFLLPYPKVDIQLTESLDKVATELQHVANAGMLTYRCYLNFTNTSQNDFKVDWLLKETKKQISFADEDLNKIKHEVASFLKVTEIKKKQLSKRAVPLAVACAVGLFGTGIMFGASDVCGILGIFGSCQEKARTNAEKYREYTIAIGDNLRTQPMRNFSVSQKI